MWASHADNCRHCFGRHVGRVGDLGSRFLNVGYNGVVEKRVIWRQTKYTEGRRDIKRQTCQPRISPRFGINTFLAIRRNVDEQLARAGLLHRIRSTMRRQRN